MTTPSGPPQPAAREQAVAALAEAIPPLVVKPHPEFGYVEDEEATAGRLLDYLDANPAAKAALAAWVVGMPGSVVVPGLATPDTAPVVARNRAALSGAQLLATSCVECGHSRDRHPDGADCGENDGCQEFIWPDTAPVVAEERCLATHVRFVHRNEADGLSARDLLDFHEHEHDGPGTIRNHPRNDYSAPIVGPDMGTERETAEALRELVAAVGCVPYHRHPRGGPCGYPDEGHREYSCPVCIALNRAETIVGPQPPAGFVEGLPFTPPAWPPLETDTAEPMSSETALDRQRLLRAMYAVLPYSNWTLTPEGHASALAAEYDRLTRAATPPEPPTAEVATSAAASSEGLRLTGNGWDEIDQRFLHWHDVACATRTYKADTVTCDCGLEAALRFAISDSTTGTAEPAGLDAVYAERNRLVAALAHLFSNAAWRGLDPAAPDWTVVYIDLPSGQVSWHIPDAEMEQFPALALRDPTGWDGHDTDEKYRRLAALRRGDICRDVAEAVERAVNHERELPLDSTTGTAE